MATEIRTLDEGAWVNVNNERTVGVSDVWPLADHAICDCDVAFFLVEVFVAVGVDGPWVEARAAGQCIGCGDRGTTGWLRVGRVGRVGRNDDEEAFRPVATETVRRPA